MNSSQEIKMGRTAELFSRLAYEFQNEKKRDLSILVIDDDPVFRAWISRIARDKAIHVTVCTSMAQIDPESIPKFYDVIVLDYYLDGLKSNLKGTDIAKALECVPILLISNNDHCVEAGTPWPGGIRHFVNKRKGVSHILDLAERITSANEHDA